ncbi:MAG TPA: hypothetical protein VJ208_01725 [Candidatus Nanoarchaeia archaeon]|nr:hypothetical protein [Candidatus Nanoarchaeia archaeon]
MEKEINVTREELDDFMRQIEGIKSTIEILQDKELMRDIEESEENRKKGKIEEFIY